MIDYYTKPSDEIFNEVKDACIKLWKTHQDKRYVESKVSRIKDLKNVEDNMMFMLAMFDIPHLHRLSRMLSDEARSEIYERLLDGSPLLAIIFI